jgi:hypothetical protein
MKRAVIPAAGVAVLLACAPALGAATFPSGKYKGTTDKGWPVQFKVTARQPCSTNATPTACLVHFKFSKFVLKCSDGDTVKVDPLDSGPKKLTIRDTGKFGFTVTYKNGGRWTAKGKVKSNGKASGTVRLRVNFDASTNKPDPNGSILCDSGKRPFTAKH